MRMGMAILAVLVLAGCGKTDPVNQGPFGSRGTFGPYYGNGGVAPFTPSPFFGGYGNSGGGAFPRAGGFGNSLGGGFYPQIPTGYPNSYTPFLPIDQFMRSHPQTLGLWNQTWAQWQVYAAVRQIPLYHFPRFYFDFLPQVWRGSNREAWGLFHDYFYPWLTPDFSFPPNIGPDFWTPYVGMPFDPFLELY